jgi:polyisoprenoid-binding protein YceI
MLRGIQIAAAVMVVVAVVSIGAFFYLTREIAAPSENVQDSVQQLESSDSSGNQIVFRISQDDSQVEYNIHEVLNGAAKTVVGTTSQVAGDILVNLSHPSQSQIGDISINARTFATDDSRRDNSVARFILQSESDANQFITFQPTSISGLPAKVSAGDTLQFQVTGNLTIAGVTQAVTFDITATLKSDNQLTGHAKTIVQRSDFNLNIPNVPFVANVGNDVTLKLDFVANAVNANTSNGA